MKKLEKLTLNELEVEMPKIPQFIQEQIKGGAVTAVFDRTDDKIYIYCNGELYGTYDAANETTCSSQGEWSNGTYSMNTQYEPRTHGSGDTFTGSYGVDGAYIANNFYDANGNLRSGMGIHSGRSDNTNALTNGCIRTTTEAMDAIQCAIGQSGGGFTSITVRD